MTVSEYPKLSHHNKPFIQSPNSKKMWNEEKATPKKVYITEKLGKKREFTHWGN